MDTKDNGTTIDNNEVVIDEKIDQLPTESKNTSSTPDSPLNDPLRNIPDDDKSIPITVSSSDHDFVIQKLASVNIEKPVSESPDNETSRESPDQESPLPISSTPLSEFTITDKDLAMASPPTQEMDRSSEYDPNRIPSSVFDRTKSTNPADWSMCSNESLFSIHMGTMSFTKDQFLFRSGELGLLPGEASTSGQMFNYSAAADQSPAYSKSGELRTDIMREVIKENDEPSHEKFNAESRLSHISFESGNSTKSFAFPVLAGDGDQGSVKMVGSAKMGPERHRSMSQPPAEPSPELEPKDSVEATPQASKTKWFPCFSCCPFCC